MGRGMAATERESAGGGDEEGMSGSWRSWGPWTGTSERVKRWARGWVGRVLAQGPLPRHVALIMDGNRRFARKRGKAVSEGHAAGYRTLLDCLQWLRDLGVTHVTAYAFSLENFRRPENEVAALMDLAAAKLDELHERLARERSRGGQLMEVRVVGDLAALPPHVRRAASRIMLETRGYGGMRLDIAFGYTSSAELASANARVGRAVVEGVLRPQDVNEEVLDQCMWTRGAPGPDLVLRTSGETRLSDFLLWQGGHAELVFQRVLWPNFSFFHLVSAICTYQRSQHKNLHATCGHHKAKASESRLERLGRALPAKDVASSLHRKVSLGGDPSFPGRPPSPSSPLASPRKKGDLTISTCSRSTSASSDEDAQVENDDAVSPASKRVAVFLAELESEELACLREWSEVGS